MRWLLIALIAAPAALSAPAFAKECTRADFEAVVDQAGSTLRRINGQKKPLFQAKLRALREKRNWNDAQFRKMAVPFVQDAKIAAYDDQIRQRLFDITNLGTSGEDESAAGPDCALLEQLRSALNELVKTLEAKWAHMFAKIDKALVE